MITDDGGCPHFLALVASELATLINDFEGVTPDIDIRDPGCVSCSEGKAVRVLDNR